MSTWPGSIRRFGQSWHGFADRLEGFQRTAHAVKFTLVNPLPDQLIEDLVRVHVREIDASQG